uniref:Chemokine interleukin-8-like domain-containing protein n=1 Tax=Bos indicus x Bos taurus TaxID=30522 RepID=A0A4W2BSX1_BOBOX
MGALGGTGSASPILLGLFPPNIPSPQGCVLAEIWTLLLFHPEFKVISQSFGGGPYHPAECCLTYVSRPVPRQRVSSYYETSSQCPKPGIIFITKKGHYICANPRDGWVQDYIKELEE